MFEGMQVFSSPSIAFWTLTDDMVNRWPYLHANLLELTDQGASSFLAARAAFSKIAVHSQYAYRHVSKLCICSERSSTANDLNKWIDCPGCPTALGGLQGWR